MLAEMIGSNKTYSVLKGGKRYDRLAFWSSLTIERRINVSCQNMQKRENPIKEQRKQIVQMYIKSGNLGAETPFE